MYGGSNITFELADWFLSKISVISLWFSTLLGPAKLAAWKDAAKSEGCMTPAAAAALATRAAAICLTRYKLVDISSTTVSQLILKINIRNY